MDSMSKVRKNRRDCNPPVLLQFFRNYICVLSLRLLTKGQLQFLRPMITDNTLELFTTDHDFNFGIKISGSGGGGYVLGFTDEVDATSNLLRDFEVVWL